MKNQKKCQKPKTLQVEQTSVVKNPPVNTRDTGDMGLIPGSGRSLEGGQGNPFQYSCLENTMEREAWWATVHEVTKSQKQLSD